MALTKEELEILATSLTTDTEVVKTDLLTGVTGYMDDFGKYHTDTGEVIVDMTQTEMRRYEDTGRYIEDIVLGTTDIPLTSWEMWLLETEDTVKGFSIPGLGQLTASLSGVGEAVLAPVLAVLATFGEHITAIKEFISNLASDIASGMEDALGVIGTIVIDPLLGILSAFGDYLGDKLSGFIENAVGEQ